MAHPGGLSPVSDEATEHEAWRRIEYWPNGVIAVQSGGGQAMRMRLFDVDIGSARARDEILRWFDVLPPVSQSLAVYESAPRELPAVDEIVDLSQPENLSKWLGLWGAALATVGEATTPLIRPRLQGIHQRRERMQLAYITVAAALLCALHYGWFSYQLAGLSDERAMLETAQTDMEFMRDSEKKRKQQFGTLQGEEKRIEEESNVVPRVIDALRQRPAALLAALADKPPMALVIDRIGGGRDNILIHGLCRSPQHANDLAAHLKQRLGRFGWSVSPPAKQGLGLLPEGGPWSFDLSLLDMGLAAFDESDSLPGQGDAR